MTIIRIPPTLRTETGGERQGPAAGDTVRALPHDRMSRLHGPPATPMEDTQNGPLPHADLAWSD